MRKFISVILIGCLVIPASASSLESAPAQANESGFCRQVLQPPKLAAETVSTPQEAIQGVPITFAEDSGDAVADLAESTVSGSPPLPSPPPPPPPSADVIASARGDRSAPSSSPIALPTPDRPQYQAGTLTAGEHDDVLNPLLYARYVKQSQLGQKIRDLPVLKTEQLLSIVVQDKQGDAISLADVSIECSDGNRISLRTQADGKVQFFPDLDRLSRNITIRVSKNGRTVIPARRFVVADNLGSDVITLVSDKQRASPVQKLDLMLVIDTTGSMSDELRFLQVELESVLANLRARHGNLSIRIGFVFYRDEGDEYTTRTVDLKDNLQDQKRILAVQAAGGGGDYPEAMDQALIRAANQNWRDDAIRSLMLVADAPPHSDKFARTWRVAEYLRTQRIHIVPVAASGVADEAEYIMRAMAASTQSQYVFLTDDSGVGNAHAKPAIDCYLVTRLDHALRRVLDSQISGKRIEPKAKEVVRSVGQYDAGKCTLPPTFSTQQEG